MPRVPNSDVICVTSAPPSWEPLLAYTAESQAAYCKARGYDYDVEVADLYDQRAFGLGKGPVIGIRGFHKFNRILHFMPLYKYVVWLDADLVVTNRDFDLRRVFAEYDGNWFGMGEVFPIHPPSDLILCYDWNGFNSTVQLWRSTPLTQAFAWACNNTGRDLFLYHGWHEMEALRYFSSKPPYDRLVGYESIKRLCAILPECYEPSGVPRQIMEPYAWQPGDFALHLSALSIERRTELARKYVEVAWS